jgi:hypothetical protein
MYRIADIFAEKCVIGHWNVAPCPFFQCALKIMMLITVHPAGEALLP